MKRRLNNRKDCVLTGLDTVLLNGDLIERLVRCIVEAREYIEELTTPRWETPEQYQKRTGNLWLDKAPVYFRPSDDYADWTLVSFEFAKYQITLRHSPKFQIICASEAGPPPNNWRPELKN
jgi:hypothetical protein